MTANGFLERSTPVILVYSASALVNNWMLEVKDVGDVACSVDDMRGTNYSGTFVQRGWSEGREDKGLGYGRLSRGR